MIQNKKRIISLILMLTLLVSALVVGAITASAEGEGSYVKVTSADDFTSGQYVIVANGYALTKYASKWVEVVKPTISGDEVTDTKGAVWTITVSGNTATLKDSSGQFIKPSGSNTNGITTGEYSWTWSINNQTFQFAGTGVKLALNSGSSYKARAYKDGTISGNPNGYPCNFTLYKFVESTSGEEGGETPECVHANTVPTDATPATCTEVGYTEGTFCNDCETYTEGHVEIPATGHEKTSSVIVKATCTTPGSETVTCDKCEAVVSVTTTPALAYRFEKVTEGLDDWTGTYLIVYTNGTEYFAFNGGLETLDAVSNSIAVSVSNGIIAADNNTLAAVFDVEKNEGSYTLKSASGYYIGKTANSNGLDSKTDTKYSVTFAIDSENAVITASGGTVLRYNAAADQNRFRFYKSGQKDVQLYKLITGEHTYVDGKCSACGHEAETFEEAITGTGTVTLTEDLELAGPLVIGEKLVIDLNGHVLEATGLVTFAADAIIDSSAKWENGEFVEPTGLLIIPQFKIVIPTPGLYMPIWNTVDGVSGYQFVEMKDQQKVVDTVKGDDSFNVVFRPSIGDTAFNNKIFGDVENNGLEFVINVYNGTLVDGEFVAADDEALISGMLDPETVATAYEGDAVKAVNVKFTGADFTDGNCYSVELFIRIKTLDENGAEKYINAYYTILAVVGAEGEI